MVVVEKDQVDKEVGAEAHVKLLRVLVRLPPQTLLPAAEQSAKLDTNSPAGRSATSAPSAAAAVPGADSEVVQVLLERRANGDGDGAAWVAEAATVAVAAKAAAALPAAAAAAVRAARSMVPATKV